MTWFNVTYTEKGYGMHRAVREAGYELRQFGGGGPEGDGWKANSGSVQAIMDSFDPLAYEKTQAAERISADFESRAYAPVSVPASGSLVTINATQSAWLLLRAIIDSAVEDGDATVAFQTITGAPFAFASVAEARTASSAIKTQAKAANTRATELLTVLAAMTDWAAVRAWDVTAAW